MGGPPALGVLGTIFMAMRALQGVALLGLIALSANFVVIAQTAGDDAPLAVVATLFVASSAALYTVLSSWAYHKSVLSFTIPVVLDTVCLVAGLVCGFVVGRPVRALACGAIPSSGEAAAFLRSLFADSRTPLDYYHLRWSDSVSCFKLKAVWGLGICLGVVYFLSAAASLALRRRHGKFPGAKDFE